MDCVICTEPIVARAVGAKTCSDVCSRQREKDRQRERDKRRGPARWRRRLERLGISRQRACLICEIDITDIPGKTRVCSEHCRRVYNAEWTKRWYAKAYGERKFRCCAVCATDIDGLQRNTRFCSDACRREKRRIYENERSLDPHRIERQRLLGRVRYRETYPEIKSRIQAQRRNERRKKTAAVEVFRVLCGEPVLQPVLTRAKVRRKPSPEILRQRKARYNAKHAEKIRAYKRARESERTAVLSAFRALQLL